MPPVSRCRSRQSKASGLANFPELHRSVLIDGYELVRAGDWLKIANVFVRPPFSNALAGLRIPDRHFRKILGAKTEEWKCSLNYWHLAAMQANGRELFIVAKKSSFSSLPLTCPAIQLPSGEKVTT